MDNNALDIILRLQDELSPALAQAQASIRAAAGNLAGMTDAVKASNQAHADLIGTLKEVGQAFGFAFTLDAAVEFLHQTLENANALQTLSVQTRISVEDLQVLTSATKEFGVEGDTLGRALFQLSQRIAGNDTSVATAYALMGISIDQIKDKNALDLFLTTERGLGTLQGTLRDTAAADLYGGKLGASMAAFSTGSDEAVAKARALNTVASQESVKALADYQNAIDRTTTSLKAMSTEILGRSAQMFNVIADSLDKGGGKWATFVAVLQDAFDQQMHFGTGTENTTRLLDGLNQSTDKSTASTKAATEAQTAVKVALDAHGQAAQFMATLELNSAKPLLDWQLTYLQQLDAMGSLNAKTAAGIGVNAQQLQAYTETVKANTDAQRIMAEVAAEADAAAMTGYTARIKILGDLQKATQAAYSVTAQIDALQQLDAAEQVEAVNVEHSLTTEQDRAKVRADAAKQHIDILNQIAALRLKLAGQVNVAQLAEFDAQTTLNAAMGRDASGAILIQKSALDVLNQAMEALHQKKMDGISQSAQEQVLIDAYTKSLYDDAVAQDALTQSVSTNTAAIAANSAAKQQAASFSLAGSPTPAKFAGLSTTQLQDMGYIDLLDRVTMAGAAAGLGTFGGSRDAGGPVMPGQSYLIGTGAQPELFTPTSPGTMTPAGGGNVTYVTNNYITSPLGTPAAIAKAVDDALMARQRNTGQR